MSPEDIHKFLRSVPVHRNPWRLTPKQCLTLHLICTYGSRKAACEATGIKETTMAYHVDAIRKRRRMRGDDVRIYLQWHQHFLGLQQ